MKRRIALAVPLLVSALRATADSNNATEIQALLQAGACVFLMRHAETDSGIGDPPNFLLGDCRTQRNLNQAGREQSHRLGQWFKTRQLHAHAIQSGAWCRCRDTADLAFGTHTVLSALNSTFNNTHLPDPLTQSLRLRLKAVPVGEFEVWITHQVNITALTGEFTAMGEALIVDAKGAVLARTTLS
jgi:phosphohistidine phosphatase SixA